METYKVMVDDAKSVFWYNDKDELHRLDGPAIQGCNGLKAWWVDGKCHRLDGPAIEDCNDLTEWWVDGKLHRLDGPAIEDCSGRKEWWVEGKRMSEKKFNEYIKPKPTCEGKVVEIDGVKYKLVKA